ncbi:phage tail sheath C-terminal domain-containing protein [Pseudomonas aeruginosa]|uniref:phage tail sheath family protein n=1 Tax=Pseudomonas aeruginosa TaxID=287 RepID=UPI002ADDA0C4|nr:phage tail sheath C-terminal domain-containing protein [Pseudomonas aeruginosa]MEA0988992.1 phage tail sheath C-terminal domain-containing protein [Pseudomonas aeruginosa]
MSEVYAVPGVYVTESNAPALSIQSGETAVPVFVGLFHAVSPPAKGAPLSCVRIESWLDFTQQFGPSDRITVKMKTPGVHATSYVGSYSVRLYFENGGGPCYVLAINNREDLEDPAVLAQIVPAIGLCPDITLLCWCEYIQPFTRKSDKQNDVLVDIDKDIYAQLSQLLGASATSGGNRGMFLLTDAGVSGEPDKPSQWTFSTPSVLERTQVAAYFPALSTAYERDYGEYVDQGVQVMDFNADQTKALTEVGLITKDQTSVTLDRIRAKAVESGPQQAAMKALVSEVELQLNNSLSALQKNAEPVLLRASVAMAGVYARVDRERGVWKAPANVGLLGVTGLIASGMTQAQKGWAQAVRIDDELNTKLVDAKVNAIRLFRGQGTVVWGTRTMSDPHLTDWLYIPVRRLFNAVERDARAALRTVVFEPNNAATWESVRGALDHYLNALWRRGALQGENPTQAYFVQVGLGSTMTAEEVAEGKLIVKMGLAAVRPAEFIVLELTQDVALA